MLTIKFREWLNKADPYAIQRMACYKAVIIATVLVFAYWCVKPANFIAYVLPTLVLSLYDMPSMSRMKQKDRALWFSFTGLLICCITFYLLTPFRLIFLLYSIIFFILLYQLTSKWFPSLRNVAIIIIATGAIFMTVKPQGSLQIAYDIFFSSLLSMSIIYVCLKCLRGSYFTNWLFAVRNYIFTLEHGIDETLKSQDQSFYADEVNHINMICAYQGLLKKNYLMPAYKSSINLRYILFALSNVYYEKKNNAFWIHVKHQLQTLRQCMEQKIPCNWDPNQCSATTPLQQMTVKYLNRAIIHWNALCTQL